MKPEQYVEYSEVFDDTSCSRLFPSLTQFCKTVIDLAPEPSTIADIGAGTGKFTAYLQQRLPYTVFDVVEPSEPMMAKAAARLSPTRTRLHSVRFSEATLLPQDVIIFQRSLYAIPSPDTKRITERLNPGGLLAIMTPSQKYNIDRYEEQFADDKDWWPKLRSALVMFNEGVDTGDFVLYDRARLVEMFPGLTLVPTTAPEQHFFIKDVSAIPDS